jgi:hypothetical protein
MRDSFRLLVLAFLLTFVSVPAARAMTEQECKAAGGVWQADKGSCSIRQVSGNKPAGGNPPPDPAQGVTINCASGDPLKGLNVHKSSSSAKGPVNDCGSW